MKNQERHETEKERQKGLHGRRGRKTAPLFADRYFVWTDPDCGGVDPAWEELTRAEFIRFLNDPDREKRKKNRARKFVVVEDDWEMKHFSGFEVTPEQFRVWDRDEHRRIAEERKWDALVSCSLDAPAEGEDGEMTVAETIPDRIPDETPEELRIWLAEALTVLTESEREAIDWIYFENDDLKPVQLVAFEKGVRPSTLYSRLQSAIRKLRRHYKFYAKFRLENVKK